MDRTNFRIAQNNERIWVSTFTLCAVSKTVYSLYRQALIKDRPLIFLLRIGHPMTCNNGRCFSQIINGWSLKLDDKNALYSGRLFVYHLSKLSTFSNAHRLKVRIHNLFTLSFSACLCSYLYLDYRTQIFLESWFAGIRDYRCNS